MAQLEGVIAVRWERRLHLHGQSLSQLMNGKLTNVLRERGDIYVNIVNKMAA